MNYVKCTINQLTPLFSSTNQWEFGTSKLRTAHPKNRRLATLGAFQLPRAQAQNRHPRASQVNLGTGEPGEKHRKIMGKTWENPW